MFMSSWPFLLSFHWLPPSVMYLLCVLLSSESPSLTILPLVSLWYGCSAIGVFVFVPFWALLLVASVACRTHPFCLWAPLCSLLDEPFRWACTWCPGGFLVLLSLCWKSWVSASVCGHLCIVSSRCPCFLLAPDAVSTTLLCFALWRCGCLLHHLVSRPVVPAVVVVLLSVASMVIPLYLPLYVFAEGFRWPSYQAPCLINVYLAWWSYHLWPVIYHTIALFFCVALLHACGFSAPYCVASVRPLSTAPLLYLFSWSWLIQNYNPAGPRLWYQTRLGVSCSFIPLHKASLLVLACLQQGGTFIASGMAATIANWFGTLILCREFC